MNAGQLDQCKSLVESVKDEIEQSFQELATVVSEQHEVVIKEHEEFHS